SLTRLTVLTVSCNWFSPIAVILIVRVPNRPSRPKTISIPSVRRKVCARRSRPASARALFGHPDRLVPTCGRVGCASRPLRTVGHELAQVGRHRVGGDDVLDRVAPVVGIGGFKGARGAEGALAGRGPECEVSRTRQPPEAHPRQYL